jgi:hypothetical protein
MSTTDKLWAPISRIAAFGLSPEPEPVDLTVLEWDRFLERLEIERLTGLAVAGWEAGWLELSYEQAEDLLSAQREAMLLCLKIERVLLQLADRFDRDEIEFVALKGPALAHTVYPDPSCRPFGDLDVLVRTRDWRRALAILADMEFGRRLPEPRPGFDERFGKAATHDREDGIVVDLHRTLVVGPFGLWIEPEELFDHTAPFTLAGRELRRLDDTAQLTNVCVHAALGFEEPLLLPIRDVAEVAGREGPDWNVIADWSKRWHLGVVCRHALELMAATLGVGWSVEAKAAVTSGRRCDRKALVAYTTDRRNRGGTTLATLRAVRGARRKAAYVRTLVWPDRSFVRGRAVARGKSLLRRWRTPAGWLTGRRRS